MDRAGSEAHVAGTSLVHLSCTARGIPVPTITWLKNGQTLSVSSRIVISTSPPNYFPTQEEAEFASRRSNLFIQSLELIDSAEYICRAENTGAQGKIFIVDSDPVNISVQCKICAAASVLICIYM